MSEHEKDLSIILAFLLLVGMVGLLPFVLLSNELGNIALVDLVGIPWLTFVFFIILGIAGLYFELTTMDKIIREFEINSIEWPLSRRHVIGIGIGLSSGLILLGLFSFGLNRPGIFKAAYNLTIAGFGFALMFLMMLLGAIFARVRRTRTFR